MRANDVVRILVKNNVDPDIADEKGEYLPSFKRYVLQAADPGFLRRRRQPLSLGR